MPATHFLCDAVRASVVSTALPKLLARVSLALVFRESATARGPCGPRKLMVVQLHCSAALESSVWRRSTRSWHVSRDFAWLSGKKHEARTLPRGQARSQALCPPLPGYAPARGFVWSLLARARDAWRRDEATSPRARAAVAPWKLRYAPP